MVCSLYVFFLCKDLLDSTFGENEFPDTLDSGETGHFLQSSCTRHFIQAIRHACVGADANDYRHLHVVGVRDHVSPCTFSFFASPVTAISLVCVR